MRATELRTLLDRAWDQDVTVEFHDATTGRRCPVNSHTIAGLANGSQERRVLVLSNIPGRAQVLHGQEPADEVRMRDENRAIVESVCGPFVKRSRQQGLSLGMVQVSEQGLDAMLNAARAEGADPGPQLRAGAERFLEDMAAPVDQPRLGLRWTPGPDLTFNAAIEALAIALCAGEGLQWDGMNAIGKGGFRDQAYKVAVGKLEDAYPDDFPAAAAAVETAMPNAPRDDGCMMIREGAAGEGELFCRTCGAAEGQPCELPF